MSFPTMGLTHCLQCRGPLEPGEIGYCKECRKKDEEKAELERQKVKQQKQKEELKKEVLKELKKEMNIKQTCNNKKSSSENYLGVITISSIKPNNLTYDQWYADIGYRVIERYQKGFDGVLLAIDNKTKV